MAERSTCGPESRATPRRTCFDNYEWHIVSTNPANGKWFREDGQGQYRDLHITNVEGTVYTFESQETGRPYTLTDMNGNKVFFDRGRLLTTFQVDTKGDDDLSNDEFIEGSFQLLADNGARIRCGTSTASGVDVIDAADPADPTRCGLGAAAPNRNGADPEPGAAFSAADRGRRFDSGGRFR